MQAPPEPKHTPPEPMQQCNTRMQQRAKICSLCSLCLGRLDRLHQAVRPPTIHLTAWGRLDRPMWPALHQTAQNLPEPIGTSSKCSQVPKSCTNFSPLTTKVITRCYTCPNEQVRYSTGRNDLNYMITNFHNHWTRLIRIWAILRKFTLSWAKT
jgi:hypothetical protein